jgi:hypothetical protein
MPPSGERALIWKPRPYLSYCIISSTYKSKWEIFQPYFIGEFRRPCPTFCNLKEIFFSDGRRNSPGGKGPNMRLWHNSHCTGVFSRQVRMACGIAACILGRRGGPACPASPLPGTEPRSGNPQLLGNLAQLRPLLASSPTASRLNSSGIDDALYPSNTILLPQELIRGVHPFEGGSNG